MYTYLFLRIYPTSRLQESSGSVRYPLIFGSSQNCIKYRPDSFAISFLPPLMRELVASNPVKQEKEVCGKLVQQPRLVVQRYLRWISSSTVQDSNHWVNYNAAILPWLRACKYLSAPPIRHLVACPQPSTVLSSSTLYNARWLWERTLLRQRVQYVQCNYKRILCDGWTTCLL